MDRANRYWVLVPICLLAFCACGKKDDAEAAKLRAELDVARAQTEAARAEAEAANAKLALQKSQSGSPPTPTQSADTTQPNQPTDLPAAGSSSPEVSIEAGRDGFVLKPLDAEVELAENGDIKILVLNKAILTDRGADFRLDKIRGLKKLRGIRIHSPGDTDFVLQQLPTLGFDRLDTVVLVGAPVTSRGLASLGKFPALRNVSLRSCKVEPGAWAHLWGLNELKRLEIAAGSDLAGTKWGIKDDTVAGIGKLRKLEVLYLGYTSITDRTVAEVCQCDGLKALFLPDTGVTDTGLEHVKKLKKLELLELSGTKVTDAGLGHLTALPDLQRLYLVSANSVSDGGIKKLQAALPRCRVERARGASADDYP